MAGNESERNEVMKESDVKKLLERNGIRTPRGVTVRKIEKDLDLNYPVALKVSDPKILHKSDVGGVVINIRDRDALELELSKMREKFPESEFLVEEMIRPGVELIVGVVYDDNFGHSLMLGSGGIYTELYRDVSFRLIPIEKLDAADMINELKISRFCDGFRGQRIDREELENFLLKISSFVLGMGRKIEQLDLNPVIASDRDIIVADAKLILGKEDQ